MSHAGGPPMRDISGERSGRLVVLWLVEYIPHGESWWLCECDCGGIRLARHRALTREHTRSCGCLRREIDRDRVKVLIAKKVAERDALLETLLDVMTRCPQRPGELLQALRDNWGDVDERRFYRLLRLALQIGLAEQHGRRQTEDSTYSLPRQQRRAA